MHSPLTASPWRRSCVSRRVTQSKSSGVTQKRPLRVTSKPAIKKARDIDFERSLYRLPRYEQCFERREETTSHRTGEARVVLATHRARKRCTSRNRRCLPECGGAGCASPGCLGEASAGKTGHRGDPRPSSPFFRKPGISG